MAQGVSGYFEITATKGFTVRVFYNETYDTESNRSAVSITDIQIYCKSYPTGYYFTGSASIGSVAVATMDSTKGYHSVYALLNNWASMTVKDAPGFPWTQNVTHNSDGTASVTITLKMTGYTLDGKGGGNGWTVSGTNTIQLTTIPRASSAAFGSFTIGSSGAITINRASGSFTHNLIVSLGGMDYTIAEGVETSYQWTPDTETWAPRIPAAKSAECTMTVQTYSGSTLVGEYSGSFTLHVPSLPPLLSDGFATASYDNTNTAASDIDAFVAGYSSALVTFDAAKIRAQYDAEIVEQKISCGNLTVNTAPYKTQALFGTSETIICTVTDSRGYTASGTLVVSLLPYAKPTLKDISVYRCDADGTANKAGQHIYASATLSFAGLDGKNTCTLNAYYRPQSGSYGDPVALTSGEGKIIASGLSAKVSYMAKIVATDSLGNTSAPYEMLISTDELLFRLLRDRGSVGKYPEHERGFDFGWNLYMCGNEIYDGNEWLWGNPPMEIGTAYLTKQFYMGSPVYTMLVDLGTLPGVNGYEETDLGFLPTNILRVSGAAHREDQGGRYTATIPLPGPDGKHLIDIGAHDRYIVVRTGTVDVSADFSLYTGTAQIWYTMD